MNTGSSYNDDIPQSGHRPGLLNNNDILRLVFDKSLMGIVIVKARRNNKGELTDLEYILANETAQKLLGNDIVGKSFLELNPGGHDIGQLARYCEAIDSGKTVDFEKYYTGKGLHKWFRNIAVKFEDGLIICFEDITDRKKVVEGIKKQASILQQSEALAKAGSWEYDLQTRQLTWSDGMYRLFEIPKSSAVTPSIYTQLVVESDSGKAERLIMNMTNGLQPLEEILKIRVNGKVKTIAIKTIPLQNNEGEVGKMLGVDRDVTDVQAAEEKIVEINKILVAKNRELASLNSELKTFTSIAANDYKETLRQLYLSLEFIASNDAANLSNSGKANIRRAQSAVQRMKLLTDDLVSYSRLQEVGVWEPRVNLNAVLKEVLHDFDRRSFLLDAKIDCKPLPQISGYPFLISLVFHHLIENALRFKKDNGVPVLKVYCEESVNGSSLPHEAARPDTIYHVITIADEGIGFPREEAEKIFGIFYRLDNRNRHKGSGIGLAICKKIMDMHEGFIIAESQPGEGSAFHCFFPYEARENPPL